MLSKKRFGLRSMLAILLCSGVSSDSMSMNRSLSPGSKYTLESFHKSKSEEYFAKSIEMLNSEKCVKLYSCDGKKFVLKKNTRGYGNWIFEQLACQAFKDSELSGIAPPIYCTEFDDGEKKEYYVIYPFVPSSKDDEIFNFVNYLDWKEDNPSKLRCFKERKRIWENLIRQLTNIIKNLNQKGIVHRDLKPDNILLYINEEQNQLNATVIDFDAYTQLECAESSALSADLVIFSRQFVKDYLLPIFRGKFNGNELSIDQDSKEYFRNVSVNTISLLNRLRKLINEIDLNTYSKYINKLPDLLSPTDIKKRAYDILDE